MSQQQFTLVSHYLCPYVQRAAIALTEKGVAADMRYIDLAAKPDWFLAISPFGKVPLLLDKQPDGSEAVLFESAVICEYLEDILPDRPLHPSNPLSRARHRGWIEFGSSMLTDVWGLETAKDEKSYTEKLAFVRGKFTSLESQLGDGPFFAGEAFSLVDATFAPIFRMFDVFDADVATGAYEGLPKLVRWRDALAARESVQKAVPPDYAERFIAFVLEQDSWILKR